MQGGQGFHPPGRGEEEEVLRKVGAEEGSEQGPSRGHKEKEAHDTNRNEESGITVVPTDTEMIRGHHTYRNTLKKLHSRKTQCLKVFLLRDKLPPYPTSIKYI